MASVDPNAEGQTILRRIGWILFDMLLITLFLHLVPGWLFPGPPAPLELAIGVGLLLSLCIDQGTKVAVVVDLKMSIGLSMLLHTCLPMPMRLPLLLGLGVALSMDIPLAVGPIFYLGITTAAVQYTIPQAEWYRYLPMNMALGPLLYLFLCVLIRPSFSCEIKHKLYIGWLAGLFLLSLSAPAIPVKGREPGPGEFLKEEPKMS